MNTTFVAQFGRRVLNAAGLCALCGCLNLNSLAADPEPVDRNRAQQLFKRSQQGEKLSPEDQAYLDRAKAVRQQTHGRGVGAASRGAPATPSVKTYKSSKKPDIENQKYGPSASNVLDLWQAESNHPVPLVIYI